MDTSLKTTFLFLISSDTHSLTKRHRCPSMTVDIYPRFSRYSPRIRETENKTKTTRRSTLAMFFQMVGTAKITTAVTKSGSRDGEGASDGSLTPAQPPFVQEHAGRRAPRARPPPARPSAAPSSHRFRRPPAPSSRKRVGAAYGCCGKPALQSPSRNLFAFSKGTQRQLLS